MSRVRVLFELLGFLLRADSAFVVFFPTGRYYNSYPSTFLLLHARSLGPLGKARAFGITPPKINPRIEGNSGTVNCHYATRFLCCVYN